MGVSVCLTAELHCLKLCSEIPLLCDSIGKKIINHFPLGLNEAGIYPVANETRGILFNGPSDHDKGHTK